MYESRGSEPTFQTITFFPFNLFPPERPKPNWRNLIPENLLALMALPRLSLLGYLTLWLGPVYLKLFPNLGMTRTVQAKDNCEGCISLYPDLFPQPLESYEPRFYPPAETTILKPWISKTIPAAWGLPFCPRKGRWDGDCE